MGAMAFPSHLIKGLGRFQTLTEQEEIQQSVRMILSTRKGERPCNPDFGTSLDQFAFENIDTTTCNMIRQEIVSSLQMWEPRIWQIEVNFDKRPEEGILYVQVQYQIFDSGINGQTNISMNLN